MQSTHSSSAQSGARQSGALDQAMGTELTPDTMVPLMLQSEQIWTLIESFVTLVMRTRELDGRREMNNGARNLFVSFLSGAARRFA